MTLNFAYDKSKQYETLNYWSRDILNFVFLEKGLGIVFRLYFEYNFSRKILSCYVLLTDQISLSDSFYLLRYWAICVL